MEKMEKVRNRLVALAQKYTLAEQLSLEVRVLNITVSLAFVAMLLTSAVRIISGLPLASLVGILMVMALLVGLLYVNNRFSLGHVALTVVLGVISIVLAPLVFLTSGGIGSSGMDSFFVLILTLIFLLLHGKPRIFMLAVSFAAIIMVYVLSAVHPELVRTFEPSQAAHPYQLVLEHVHSIFLVGVFLGLVIVFQNRLYLKEQVKVGDSLERLRDETQTAAAIFGSNPHMTALFDSNLKLLDCNQAMIEFFGLADKEAANSSYAEAVAAMVPPTQRNGLPSVPLKDRLEQALRQGDLQFETKFVRQDRSMLVSVTMRTIPYRGGVAIVTYLVDLTDLYATRDRLLYREQLLSSVNKMSEILLSFRYANITESLTESMKILAQHITVDRIYIWKSDGNDGRRQYTREFEWLSEKAATSKTVLSGSTHSYIKIFPEWERKFRIGQAVNSPLSQLPEVEQKHLGKFDIRSILMIPVFQQGSLWGFVGFDDCRREHFFTNEEERILRSASLLMVNAIMRNEITESLVKTRESALSYAKAKSIFLANMSHEMRTPLNAVVGMTAIGKGAASVERKNYCLEKIEDASQHLVGIINDVLDMSKIEAGKLELSPVEFNFERMLRRVAGVATFKIDQKQQKFNVHIDRKIPERVFGDDQRLAQVITNLLGNAVKFTPEQGSITLDATLVKEEDQRCTIGIKVIDSGIGISAEQQSLLFHSFQQADNNTTRKYGGTGLGLVISKRIVGLMGGEIKITSEPGRGATFAFTVEVERVSGQSRRLQLPPGVNRSNIRIMAVDDDADVRSHFRDIMQQFEIGCDLAGSGREALALRERNGAYNIYFVDWKMPDMDGLELSRRIREKDEGNANSIIIMISAVDWGTISDEAGRIGVDKYIPKPLFPSAIADFISECLGVIDMAPDQPDDEVETFADRRILLAEDVAINREIVIALLEPTQVVIDSVENGYEAVRAYREAPEKYDLIFMDVQMPQMDGYEATRRIRRFEGQMREKTGATVREIPIVAMTANVFKEDIDKCIEAGMNAHVGKPLDLGEVKDILHNYLCANQLAV
ncbi:MAG: response regulator [Acidobacteriota bacterium]|jgi:signal transduction histidine kinase/CheY-like chemotaxis protein/PAS domain-containing protein|nr:response regulator [Acidobacteriota bacterium]